MPALVLRVFPGFAAGPGGAPSRRFRSSSGAFQRSRVASWHRGHWQWHLQRRQFVPWRRIPQGLEHADAWHASSCAPSLASARWLELVAAFGLVLPVHRTSSCGDDDCDAS
uniref:(northern house mosquito) hypothetical protein n=1 Tax=Culex pipiens TaxID=7175 RepID=A0A8D8FYP6_CULPI